MDINEIVEFPIRVGPVTYTYGTIFITMVAMAAVILLVWRWTRNLGAVPRRGQAILEIFVEGFDSIVAQTLGKERGRRYLPYVGSLFLFIWVCNLIGIIPVPAFNLFGLLRVPAFEEPTRNYMTELGLTVVVMAVVHIGAIRIRGLRAYLKDYIDPSPVLLPINLVGEVAQAISISFRLFGNVFGGAVILIVISGMVRSIGLPVGLNLFFGVFVGTIQAFVFTTLAMTYAAVKIAED